MSGIGSISDIDGMNNSMSMNRSNKHISPLTSSIASPTLRVALWIASLAFGSGCVSVNIGPGKTERSADVTFAAPSTPFEPIDGSKADGAWQNRKNGNTISFLSTCNDPADPTLEAVARELFTDLRDAKTITSETTTFNGREALLTEIEGRVDGVLTRIRALVFKKNACLYTLSYIGVARSFGEDRVGFDRFLKGFQAP